MRQQGTQQQKDCLRLMIDGSRRGGDKTDIPRTGWKAGRKIKYGREYYQREFSKQSFFAWETANIGADEKKAALFRTFEMLKRRWP